jgi:hypothetical protein
VLQQGVWSLVSLVIGFFSQRISTNYLNSFGDGLLLKKHMPKAKAK